MNRSTKPTVPPSKVASPPPAPPAAPSPPVSKSGPSPDSTASRTTGVTLWLTDRDVVVFSMLAAIVLVMLAVRWGQLSGWGRDEIEIERMSPLPMSMHLDPNEANWVELAQLDGIGEALAMRIVEDRETNGRYQTLDDLDRVKGIGPKTLERLRPYLRIKRARQEP